MRGYTLVECLVVLVIVTAIGCFAIPALSNLLLSNSVEAATSELYAALNYTRAMALSHRVRTVLCRSGDSTAELPSCDHGAASDIHDGYEDGWIVFVDTDNDGAPNAVADVLRRHAAQDRAAITIRGNHNAVNRIYFSAMGATSTIATFVICDRGGWGADGHQARLVTIDMGGRVRSTAGDQQSSTTKIGSCTP